MFNENEARAAAGVTLVIAAVAFSLARFQEQYLLPKRFAWTLGVAMAVSMTVITNSGIPGTLPKTLCPTCMTLVWMEAALGLCLGCKIYAWLVRRGWKSRDAEIEVCAGGVCALPTRAAAPDSAPVRAADRRVVVGQAQRGRPACLGGSVILRLRDGRCISVTCRGSPGSQGARHGRRRRDRHDTLGAVRDSTPTGSDRSVGGRGRRL